MKSFQTLSIGVIAHNEEEYMKDFFDSLLAQTDKNFEVIFLDNHSDDNTYEIAIKYSAILSKAGIYMNVSTNKGEYRYSVSKGMVLGKMECTCYCMLSVKTKLKPTFVEKVMGTFANPKVEAVIVSGSTKKHAHVGEGSIDKKTLVKNITEKKYIQEQLVISLVHARFLSINYQSFDNIQYLYDLFIFSQVGDVVCIDEPLIDEYEPENIITKPEETLLEVMEIYRLVIGMEEKARIFQIEDNMPSRDEMNEILREHCDRVEQKALRLHREDVARKYAQIKKVFV